MADNDTAALVVALSAQLSKFEKDMKGAVDIADRRTREIETRFGAMNNAITGKLQQLGSAASSNLGFAGSLLNTLGPAGVAAAVGLGAAAGGMLLLADTAQQFSEKAKSLKEGAETAGLTITQFKLLGQVGRTVGVDFDETSNFFQQFIFRLKQMQNTGSGPLFDALLKIDSGLLRQLSTTKDSAKAIDLLIAAYARLGNAADKLELSRAAGGKGGASGGRILGAAAERGGLSGIEQSADKIDEGQFERAARLRTDIDAIAAKTRNIWGGMFSDAILTNQKESREAVYEISKWINEIVRGKERAARLSNPEGATADDLAQEKESLELTLKGIEARKEQEAEHLKYLKSWGATQQQIDAEIPGLKGIDQSYESISKRLSEINEQLDKMRSQNGGALPSVVSPPSSPVPVRTAREGISGPAETSTSATVDLAILQKSLSLLGDAVTVGEQWQRKRLEIAAAAEKEGLADGVAGRALAAFSLTMQLAAISARERLGIATQEQSIEARLIQLQQDRIKFGLTDNEVQRAALVIRKEAIVAATAAREKLGIATEQEIVQARLNQLEQDQIKFGLSDNDVQRAKVIILREAKDAADALTVRQSYLPGLAQLGLDAQNARKNLDTFAVNSLNTLENSLVDVVNGTKTASEAFKSMANAIISDLARIAIRQSITGPIAAALGGQGGIFSSIFGGARAAGGPVEAGKAYLVNENTPNSELFVPGVSGTIVSRSPSIVPNSVNARGGGERAIIVQISNAPVFQAGMTPTDIAAIEARLQVSNQELRGQVQSDLRAAIRNDADTLNR